jgi:hypothetical protein
MADETKKYLVNIESNLNKYAKDAAATKAEIDKLTASNAALKKSGKDNSEEYEKNRAQISVLKKEYNSLTSSSTLLIQANKAQKGSYEQLYLLWQLAQKDLKKLGDGFVYAADGTRKLNDKFPAMSKAAADAKKSLDQFGKATNDNRLNVGNYSEAIENAMGKFSAIPGPIGAAATAVTGFGTTVKAMSKTLLATPIGWIVAGVAAIVAVLTGLFKVFKSTAEGGGKIKDLMASLHAIMDVLRVRVVSLTESLGHLFKGEFKKAGEDLKATFTGLGDAIGTATKKASELSAAQRELNKQTAFHIAEEAKEELMIQKLVFASKNKMKSDTERTAALEEAIKRDRERADIQIEFAKEQYRIDIETAANSNELQANVLSDFIEMDRDKRDILLKSATEIGEKYRDIYNILGGKEAITKLSESRAAIDKADQEFFQGNIRRESLRSTLQASIAKEAEDRVKEQITLRELEARGDLKAMKEALKFKFEEEIKFIDVSDTQKKILRIAYNDAIAAIDKESYDQADKIQQDFIDKEVKNMEEAAKLRKELADRQKADQDAGFEYQRLKAGQDLDLINTLVDAEYGAYLASKEYLNATINEKLLMEEQYNIAKQQLSDERVNMQIQEADIIAGVLGSMSNLLGKETALGKTFAVAEAVINTYAGATAAYTDKTIPSTILRIAAAASVVLNGLANVRQILAVKVPGGGGTSSMPTSIAAPKVGTPSGSTILTQPQLTQNQLNQLPNTNPLTAQDIANAIRNLPAPVVTVEDINKGQKAVNKVLVRANI